MFKLTTKAKNWKAVTSSMFSMEEEATLRLTATGIEGFVMDPSHTEAIGFTWGKESFTEYDVDFAGEEYKDLQISLKTFTAIFKRFGNEEDITLSDIDNAMLITNGVKKFQNSFYEGTSGDMKVPQVPYDKSFELELVKLEEIMTDCRTIGSEELFIESKDGKLVYHTVDMAGKVDGVMIDEFDGIVTKIGFNFSFMEPVIKTIKTYAEPKIKVELFKNAPIRITFKIIDELHIQYYLAPKV